MIVTRARVAAVITSLATPAITAGSLWLNKHTGTHVDPTEAGILAGLGGASALAAGLKWMHENAKWEKAEQDAELALSHLGIEVDVDNVPENDGKADVPASEAAHLPDENLQALVKQLVQDALQKDVPKAPVATPVAPKA